MFFQHKDKKASATQRKKEQLQRDVPNITQAKNVGSFMKKDFLPSNLMKPILKKLRREKINYFVSQPFLA